MVTSARKPKVDVDALWDHQADVKRPAPVPLDRNRIVAAAIKIADQGGLAAVSLRSVAGVLGAGPMRLYSHVTTKDELLELMVDRIYTEMVLGGSVTGDWRHASAAIALRLREAALTHDWLVDLLGGRPHQGPGALAFTEMWLAALDRNAYSKSIDGLMDALRTLNAYVLGAVRSEVAERRAERETGLSKATWQASDAEHMRRVIATGRFPMVARVVKDASLPEPGTVFARGLTAVLSGLANCST